MVISLIEFKSLTLDSALIIVLVIECWSLLRICVSAKSQEKDMDVMKVLGSDLSKTKRAKKEETQKARDECNRSENVLRLTSQVDCESIKRVEELENIDMKQALGSSAILVRYMRFESWNRKKDILFV